MPQMTQEQVNALQEKLSKMSPEELKAFQKKNCVFCQMVEGKASARKIYEDEVCLAILDIYPANPGHILLLPKEHYPIMPLIPEDELKRAWVLRKFLSTMNTIEGMEFLIDKMKKFKTNQEFLDSIQKKAAGNGNGNGAK